MPFAKDKPLVIGVTDYVKPPYDIEKSAFDFDVELHNLRSESSQNLDFNLLKECNAILAWNAIIDKNVINHLINCKLVVRYGVGFDAIDLDTLNSVSIPLCNTPDYGTEEVADTAVAMVLSLHRSLFKYNHISKAEKNCWEGNTYEPLKRSNKLSIGVIGVGRIGTAVINRLKAFGFEIIGFDPYQPSGHEKAVGYKRVENLDNLLESSDIVTLHMPLTNETRNLVDYNFINKMKKGSILVNTARGKLVKDLDCIYEALKSEHLKAVALDVLPQEPPSKHQLLDSWRMSEPWLRGRLIINPHSSYFSLEAWHEMRFKAAETIYRYFKFGTLRNQIIK